MPQPSRPSTSGSARRAAVMVALGAVAVGTLLSGQSASMGSASAAGAPVPVVSTMDDPGTGRVAPASAVVTPTGPGSQVGDPRGAATDERSSAAPAGASSVPPDALHDPAHADDGHDDPVPRPVADAPQAAEPHPGEVPDVVVGTVVRAYAEVGHVHEQGSDAGLEAAGAGTNRACSRGCRPTTT